MDFGIDYKQNIMVINDYYKKITEYIISQKDDGYLSLIEPPHPVGLENDTIIFKMGQRKFALQMTLIEKTIVFKTHILPRYPYNITAEIQDMEMLHKMSIHNSSLNFKEAKEFEHWGIKDKEIYVRDYSYYFFHLEQSVKKRDQ